MARKPRQHRAADADGDIGLMSAPSLEIDQIDEHSDAILERLLELHPKKIDLSLERLERLLARLGHPERALPPVVHVAGTNGKGSVCAMLRAGLEASGAATHVYTSPHLARFHERIRLAGRLIEEADLAALLAECEAKNGGAPITFFEITTAAAFLAFARAPADWCVLEVGLGGRLDATNVIGSPAASVITPVSHDHQQFLGDTLEDIAREKAGVIKPGVTCVVGAQTKEAAAVIDAVAAEVGAPLLRYGVEWSVRQENGRVVFEDHFGLADLPAPVLQGRHQVENAGVAVATLRHLGFNDDVCAAALSQAEWPARLQRLRRGPLVETLDEAMELWLDGGHNPAAGEALAAYLGELEERAPAALYMICGLLESKDPQGYLAPFAGMARQVYTIAIPGEQASLPADAVAAAAVKVGLSAQTAGSVEGALRAAQDAIYSDRTSDFARIVICGSLYLAGRVLRENG